MPTSKTDGRNKDLAKIHIAIKELCMDDDVYRGLLNDIQRGCNTSSKLTDRNRAKLIKKLRELGWQPKVSSVSSGKVTALQPQDRKIRAQWRYLGELGAVRDASERALAAYVKRQTGIERLQWTDSAQASKIIEALKQWIIRAGGEV